MATVAQNIGAIKTQAAVLDGLVADFRTAKAIIDAAEYEIRKAQPNEGHETIAGRIRLAGYAHALMLEPSIDGRAAVADVADGAWMGVS